jgi:hypothetical protein
MAMKYRLVDLDILHSEHSLEDGSIENIENSIAKIIKAEGISTYHAHNIIFYSSVNEIHVGVYDCGMKSGEYYIKKSDLVMISAKSAIKTRVMSKDRHTKLTTDLRMLIAKWKTLINK